MSFDSSKEVHTKGYGNRRMDKSRGKSRMTKLDTIRLLWEGEYVLYRI